MSKSYQRDGFNLALIVVQVSQRLVAVPLYCLTWVQLLGSLPQSVTGRKKLSQVRRLTECFFFFFSSSHKFSIGLKSRLRWTLWYQHVVFKVFSKNVFGDTNPRAEQKPSAERLRMRLQYINQPNCPFVRRTTVSFRQKSVNRWNGGLY